MESESKERKKYLKMRKDNIKEFKKNIKEGMLKVVGEFDNEYGETFILFKFYYRDNGIIFITGDEFDWEIGYQVDLLGNVFKIFSVNNNERAEIVKFMKKAVKSKK